MLHLINTVHNTNLFVQVTPESLLVNLKLKEQFFQGLLVEHVAAKVD